MISAMLEDSRKKTNLRMLAVDDPALLDRGDDADVVVIGQHHIRSSFGYIGAGDAHRDADIGALDRRGVIDAIAGHGDHFVIRAQGIDDAHLVLWRNPGKDSRMFHLFRQGAVVHLIQLCAGVHFVARLQQPNAFGHCPASIGIIAGDHDSAQPGAARLFQGRFYFWAGRVDHAHQARQKSDLARQTRGSVHPGFRLRCGRQSPSRAGRHWSCCHWLPGCGGASRHPTA